ERHRVLARAGSKGLDADQTVALEAEAAVALARGGIAAAGVAAQRSAVTYEQASGAAHIDDARNLGIEAALHAFRRFADTGCGKGNGDGLVEQLRRRGKGGRREQHDG